MEICQTVRCNILKIKFSRMLSNCFMFMVTGKSVWAVSSFWCIGNIFQIELDYNISNALWVNWLVSLVPELLDMFCIELVRVICFVNYSVILYYSVANVWHFFSSIVVNLESFVKLILRSMDFKSNFVRFW